MNARSSTWNPLNFDDELDESLKSLCMRYTAAGAPHTNADVLSQLSHDADEQVRRRVAENPNTPASALSTLASDDFDEVRLGVARNKKTPYRVLEEMAHDPNPEVRLAIASNSQMPDVVLACLMLDSDRLVSQRAGKSLN